MSTKSRNPRKPDLIRQELRELEKISLNAKKWLDNNPDDKVVGHVVQQDNSRKLVLLDELQESLSVHRQHQLTFAVDTNAPVEVSVLTSLLVSLQRTIGAFHSKVTQSAKVAPLYFDAVVEGSFGVLLSTEHETELLDTPYERTFNSFFDTLEKMQSKENIDPVELLSFHLDDISLLRKYRTLYRSIRMSGYDVKIFWKPSAGEQLRSNKITNANAILWQEMLADADRHPDETITSKGSIQGISLIDKTIQFVPSQQKGARVKLTFGDEFAELIVPYLGKYAVVTYMVMTKYDELHDRMVTTKLVTNIENLL